MFDYDAYAAKAAEVLDTYDFNEDVTHCLQNGITLSYEVRKYLEERHGEEVKDAFDFFDSDEFMIYMTVRYDVLWDERISHHMWRPRNPETTGYLK